MVKLVIFYLAMSCEIYFSAQELLRMLKFNVLLEVIVLQMQRSLNKNLTYFF
jgi:hypothetical protein